MWFYLLLSVLNSLLYASLNPFFREDSIEVKYVNNILLPLVAVVQLGFIFFFVVALMTKSSFNSSWRRIVPCTFSEINTSIS